MDLTVLLSAFSKWNARGSKSTTLAPLILLFTFSVTALVVSLALELPIFSVYILSLFSAVLMACIIVAYFYFMTRDPDALRSERFSIQKMAIEKGLIGDSNFGLVENKQHNKPHTQLETIATEAKIIENE